MRSSSVSVRRLSRAPRSSRVRCTRRCCAAAELADVLRQGRRDATHLVDLVPQVEDGEAQLADEAGDLGAQLLGAPTGQWVLGQRRHLVREIAERHDPLGDPVVDVAGQPVALLRGGYEANVVKQQRRLQSDRVLVELFLHGFELRRGHGSPASEHDRADDVLPDPQGERDRISALQALAVERAQTAGVLVTGNLCSGGRHRLEPAIATDEHDRPVRVARVH